MSAQPAPNPRFSRRTLIAAGAGALLLVAMALDTTVVTIGSANDVREQKFSAEAYGKSEFPKVQANITRRAVDAATLAAAIAADKPAAEAKYSVAGVYPVTFEGTVGTGKSGIYFVETPGLPPELKLRVQTGPAINGTDLRDATGTITFSQFTNQIEYQDAGSALNNEVKAQVLAGIDNSALTGKTVKVTGVFKLVNPKSWLITPVVLEVK